MCVSALFRDVSDWVLDQETHWKLTRAHVHVVRFWGYFRETSKSCLPWDWLTSVKLGFKAEEEQLVCLQHVMPASAPESSKSWCHLNTTNMWGFELICEFGNNCWNITWDNSLTTRSIHLAAVLFDWKLQSRTIQKGMFCMIVLFVLFFKSGSTQSYFKVWMRLSKFTKLSWRWNLLTYLGCMYSNAGLGSNALK